MVRKRFIVSGKVQGVGFRPFVYRLARELGLTGWVKNSSLGVVIEVQGAKKDIANFSRQLKEQLPPLALIVDFREEDKNLVFGEREFHIILSQKGEGHNVLISPDVSICTDCEQDVFNPKDRRFLYAFTNCTNCGPRFTITKSIPYDRPKTSMACFKMCEECLQEYSDPLDRRFHAQPNACPECGPEVWLVDAQNNELTRGVDAIWQTANLLLSGHIVAIKGLGGFHLACDARNKKTVLRLRQVKHRPSKALAIMVRSIEDARKLCQVSEEEERLLLSAERPIVVLAKKDPDQDLYLSPDTNTLGLMLPYTPLHLILFKFLADCTDDFPVLVMTSGNSASEPISLGNREALSKLQHIADFFLLHNRDILVRCDDSVVTICSKGKLFYRRARGYVPLPVFLPKNGGNVLGVGAELKNTICFLKNNQAFVSQHIGDLKNLETYQFFLEIISHFQKILEIEPELIVSDLHPDYMSTNFAQEQNLPHLKLQHHFAHIYAVIAENKITEPVLGWALDGTGLGEDKNFWGGELLYVDPTKGKHFRVATFKSIPLPGGDMAVLEPWRIALGLLWKLQLIEKCCLRGLESKAQKIILTMLEKNVNVVWSSSLGRILDGITALLGLISRISYEGQAPVILEKIQATEEIKELYTWEVEKQDSLLVIDTYNFFRQIIKDLELKLDPGMISRKVHLSLMNVLTQVGGNLAKKMQVQYLAFSGGVMQNRTFANFLPVLVEKKDLIPVMHHILPPNDGCISLGQAFYGQIRLR
ncbi:MAG: carbamoyltransferase HypF [Desulfonauticus sp.]|nr:carbamoyltransferase HypF [Desulfonauticus sp.]